MQYDVLSFLMQCVSLYKLYTTTILFCHSIPDPEIYTTYVTKHRFYLVMAQGPCFLKGPEPDFCRRAQSPETQAQPIPNCILFGEQDFPPFPFFS